MARAGKGVKRRRRFTGFGRDFTPDDAVRAARIAAAIAQTHLKAHRCTPAYRALLKANYALLDVRGAGINGVRAAQKVSTAITNYVKRCGR